uniref:SWIM-type domain-containing protein n=1 Tax=Kalanchoe fedtschenkoi TaxID=63787 RepID=A0A7N0T3U4_KALFE
MEFRASDHNRPITSETEYYIVKAPIIASPTPMADSSSLSSLNFANRQSFFNSQSSSSNWDKSCNKDNLTNQNEESILNDCVLQINGQEQAARLYTRNLFEIFKLEWKKSFDYIHKKSNKGFNFAEYLVGKHGLDVKYWRLVKYKSDEDLSLECTCCKFEMEGILCKHILYIVRKKNLEVIPNQYFLPRWTIGARYKNNMANNSSSSNRQAGTGASPLTIWSIQRKFSMALEIGRKSSSDLQLLESVLDTYIEKVGNKKLIDNVEEDGASQSNANAPLIFVNDQCQMTIRDPTSLAKNKGRPPLSTRFESGLELATKAKRQKTCRTCKKKGHNSSSCSMRKLQVEKVLSNQEHHE